MKSIKQWQKEIYKWAKKKGFWSRKRSALEMHALMHTEISEATESVRRSFAPLHFEVIPPSFIDITKPVTSLKYKPEGEMIELTDVVIRIMDYFEHKKWDLENCLVMKMAYNKKRPYRHGNKKY